MRFVTRFLVLSLFLTVGHAFAQSVSPQARYVPPDLLVAGEEGHYKDLAIIETSCMNEQDARAIRDQLTERGALVSIIASPSRMMGWVPPSALAAVRSAKLTTASGSVGVVSVSYTASEFRALERMAKTGTINPDVAETEESLVLFLEYIKHTKTQAELNRIADRALELSYLEAVMPAQNCLVVGRPDLETRGGESMDDIMHGTASPMSLATALSGVISMTGFFLESQSGTGTMNWNTTIYDRYRNFYLAALNYWSAFASKYGASLTWRWHLYGPTSSVTQVSGEPIVIKEDWFIPTVTARVATYTAETWGNIGRGARYCRPFNERMRVLDGSNYSLCGFVAYRATPSAGPPDTTGIWPHAAVLNWNNGDHEGVYFALDTQYWQAGDDPFSASQRNVIAHEMGHDLGCPDEYDDGVNCYTWTYRGMANINCQRNQPALGRPGLTMTGWDGIMGWNSIVGNSVATPVHVGVRSAANASPIRCFSTVPAGIPFTVKNCDNYNNRIYYGTMCIPIEGDYCMKAWVPTSRVISGTTYYFDHWEVKRRDGTTTTYDDYANELPTTAYYSSLSNPAVDVKAIFTSSPPDIFSTNTTLAAQLSPSSSSATPGRAIALKWRNKYDMTKVTTTIEWERTSGNWVALVPSNIVLGTFNVPIGQWTGAQIVTVPGTGGNVAIAANQTYRFRIVGVYNTVPGTASSVATITTRPETPAYGQYCWDRFEPNGSTTPFSLPSTYPGSSDTTFDAACPIGGWSGEFSWFIPKNDYYKIVAVGLSSTFSAGEHLDVTVQVKSGSYFIPRLRAQKAGTTTYVVGSLVDGVYHLNLTSDGEWHLLVEPQQPTYISYYLVNPTDGHFGFGEYTMSIKRAANMGMMLCLDCRRLLVAPVNNGLVILTPHPPFSLLNDGLPPSSNPSFTMMFHPDAGFAFDYFDGDFGQKNNNPTPSPIGPNTPTGVYSIFPVTHRISDKEAELVLVYPDGPAGVFERRTTTAIGGTLSAVATVPDGYVFAGWGHDTSTTTNPLSVVMWKSKKLIAYWRKKPCEPYQITKAWIHRINAVNKLQGSVVLSYGMDPAAGDSLEPGQSGLPPVPPAGFDVRWTQIPGTNGCLDDIRALKQSFTYRGTVQASSSTKPVVFSWGIPPDTTNVSYTMTVVGESGAINMASILSKTFDTEGPYEFRVTVKAKACPPPSQRSPVTVTARAIDTKSFPCVSFELMMRSRQTGDPWPFFDPYKLKFYEKSPTGEDIPAHIGSFSQLDSVLIVQICSSRDDADPKRPVIIVVDNDDPDTDNDTTKVDVNVPTPTGQGTLVRSVFQYSNEWQLMSLPLDIANTDVSVVFPDPTTNVKSFNTTTGSYEGVPSFSFGTGYWLKTPIPSVVYYGYEKNTFQWTTLCGVGEPYGYGWNLIGSVSKPVAVGSIVSVPAGGIVSIYGYNPSLGYTVPASIEPGKGYWVRVQPGTTLSMTGTKITGENGTILTKVLRNIDTRATLMVEAQNGAVQPLHLSGAQPTSTQLDALRMPPLPPSGFDVRTGDATQYVFPGENIVRIQAEGQINITMDPTPGSGIECVLFNEQGVRLGSFNSTNGGNVMLDVHGTANLRLRLQTEQTAPLEFSLGQNYPNPLAGSGLTSIPYSLSTSQDVRLVVCDVLGRTVRTLVSGETTAGQHVAVWDGRDDAGCKLPAGAYLYRLESGGQRLFKTLSITK